MELHSYAKTRASRKWTIDQKRKLVDNRITLDVLFNKKAFNLVDSWKKLMKVSDFESFDILFVRKQWTNMLSKYKNLVQRHTNDNSTDVNEETRDLLTSEWEFFDKIYRWVKYKERLHHNYNSIILEEIEDESINQQLQIASKESSAEDDIITIPSSVGHKPNDQQEQCKNHGNPKILLLSSQNNNNNNNNIPNSSQQIQNNNGQNNTSNPKSFIQIRSAHSGISIRNDIDTKQNLLQRKTGDGSGGSGIGLDKKSKNLKKKKMKNRKYNRKYSSLKQSSKRIEKKFNALCSIFAKIVGKDYPNINVGNLLTDNEESDESTSSSD